jgi:hypothetical protein
MSTIQVVLVSREHDSTINGLIRETQSCSASSIARTENRDVAPASRARTLSQLQSRAVGFDGIV